MAVTGGNTRDDRTMMIDHICHRYQPFLAKHVAKQLTDMPVWFPWVVVYLVKTAGGVFSTSWGYLEKPDSNTIEERKRKLVNDTDDATRVKPFVIEMERLVQTHVDIAADEDVGEEAEWPMVDQGAAGWLEGPTTFLERRWKV